MRTGRNIVVLAIVLVITFGSTASWAKLPPHQKVMAKRAAELDAYRNIAERILGLKVSTETTVRDFVGVSDRIALSLDKFIKGIRIDDEKTVWYDDGSCEVVAEVTLSKVVTELKKSCDEYYDGKKWKKETLEEIKKFTKERVISVVGSAAVRDTTQIVEPTTQPVVMPILNPRDRQIELPEIWKKYTAKNRLAARRIAQADAYRKLVERIYGLNLTATTSVKDFVEVNDKIQTAVTHQLKGFKVKDVRYQPDGIIEVQMSVTLKRVTTILKKVYDEHYDGKDLNKDRFEEIEKKAKRRTVTVIGMGGLKTETETTAEPDEDKSRGYHRRTETTEIIDESPDLIEIK